MIPAGRAVDVIRIDGATAVVLPTGVTMEFSPLLIAGLLVALLVIVTVVRAVRIVPQARARNVERLGRYHRTLKPGLSFVIPYVDRVYPAIDLREQVVSFAPQPVITEDNLVVEIDTVLYFQVTDPRSAAYEIASYLQAVEQLTVTTLRNVVGSMDLERTLTSRDSINSQLRTRARRRHRQVGPAGQPGGDQGDRPADEHQGRDGEADARRAGQARRDPVGRGAAAVQILTAEGDKQGAILRAEGDRTAAILKAEGQAREIDEVFQAVHRNDPDPKLLAYQYLQVLPQLAQGDRQHVLGDPQRGHLRAAGRRARLHREPAHDRGRRDRHHRRVGGAGRAGCRPRRRGSGRRRRRRVRARRDPPDRAEGCPARGRGRQR